MPSIGKNTDIPLGLSSHLPITEERARELAKTIAASMDDTEGVFALCELLLGVAPSTDTEDSPIKPNNLRAAVEAAIDSMDPLSRYSAAIAAVETLYTYTDEFNKVVTEYMRDLHQPADRSISE